MGEVRLVHLGVELHQTVPRYAKQPGSGGRGIARAPGPFQHPAAYRRANGHAGLAGLQVFKARPSHRNGGVGRLAGEAALGDLLLREHPQVVQPLHAIRLGVGALGGDLLLVDVGDLLFDLRAQQGVVEPRQRLTLLHPSALVGHDGGHAVAGELRRDAGLLARHQGA